MGNNKINTLSKDMKKLNVGQTKPVGRTPHNKASNKEQKKARKKVIEKVTITQKPSGGHKKPAKRVAKNVLSVARAEHAMDAMIQHIVLSVAAPKEFDPVRLGSTFGSYPTALANPYNVLATRSDSFTNNSNTAMGFLFRDPYRFFIYQQGKPYNSVPSTAASVYTYSYASSPWSISTIGMPVPGYPLNFSGAAGLIPYHGPKLYPGRGRGNNRFYYYMSGTAQFTWTNVNSAAVTMTYVLYQYNADNSIQQVATGSVASGGSATFISTGDGYYGLELAAVSVTQFQGTYTITEYTCPTNPPTYPIWCHRSVPDQSNNDLADEATKLYGCSLMWTNEASPLNRQGKLAAVQIPQGRDWRSFTTYDSIAVQKDAYTHDAVNGYYGFLKPTQPRDIDFIENNTHLSAGVFGTAWWDMTVPSDFLAVAVQITNTPDGQDGYFTVAAALEYRTSDQWRDTAPPKNSPELVNKAMSIIARLPQHHENPLHLSDIMNGIKSFIGDIWQGIREAVPVIADVASKTAHVAMAVAPFI